MSEEERYFSSLFALNKPDKTFPGPHSIIGKFNVEIKLHVSTHLTGECNCETRRGAMSLDVDTDVTDTL